MERQRKQARTASKEVIKSKLDSVPDLSKGVTLEVGEHKRYFIYVLEKAKKHIYIQSPWVRYNVLETYKAHIQSRKRRKNNYQIWNKKAKQQRQARD